MEAMVSNSPNPDFGTKPMNLGTNRRFLAQQTLPSSASTTKWPGLDGSELAFSMVAGCPESLAGNYFGLAQSRPLRWKRDYLNKTSQQNKSAKQVNEMVSSRVMVFSCSTQ